MQTEQEEDGAGQLLGRRRLRHAQLRLTQLHRGIFARLVPGTPPCLPPCATSLLEGNGPAGVCMTLSNATRHWEDAAQLSGNQAGRLL